MVDGYRYIQTEKNGLVKAYCDYAVDGVTIDTEGMVVPEHLTDAIYRLYYNEEQGLHYVKVADFEPVEATQLDRIEENVNKLVTETTVTDVLLGVE